MARRLNGRAIKKHRTYTVDEAARVLTVAKGTVRRWLKIGLPALTDQRPALILGCDLIDFLADRRPERRTCRLHQGFCFSCREPRDPAFGEVEVRPKTHATVMMRALCETCATVMHKPVSGARIPELCRLVTVSFVQAEERIGESHYPCPNDDMETTR
ncbi:MULTISPECIES: helix-turn-helix domain-containing protein [Aurantimonas]|uniref:helix-turn-helix domain-containing protein n=1 Tax=Aurantimonas TaxID=182269 RepID=UPI00351173D6